MGYTGRVVLAKGDGWAGEAEELSHEEFAGGDVRRRSAQAYLHEETALSYGAPELDDSADERADAATAWAAEAGLSPDREAVAETLASHDASRL
jgi:hypothetical protein